MNGKKKIVLGTANIANNYGIDNSNISKISSLKKIFFLLNKKKIYFIDTAYSYKNSEKTLAQFDLKKFNIISKLPIIGEERDKNKIQTRIVNYAYSTLKQLKIRRFYALLIHNTSELRGKKGERIFNTLKLLKQKQIVKKIGYSFYSPKELDKYFVTFKPDLIQGPLNLFDQRILNSGWIDILYKKGVEFHARSIFLQGLLLKERKKIPQKFQKYNDVFKKYHSWLNENNIGPFDACLLFVNSIKLVDKIVVGVDNLQQLNQIINFKFIKKKLNFKKMNCLKIKLINPSTW